MNARVKKDYRWNNVLAFCGVEYTKGEYRPVPKGYEDEAKKHPFLEIETEPVKKYIELVKKSAPEPVEETSKEDLIKTSEERPARKKAEK